MSSYGPSRIGLSSASIFHRTSQYFGSSVSYAADRTNRFYRKQKQNAGPYFWYIIITGLLIILMMATFAAILRIIFKRVSYFHQEMRDRTLQGIFEVLTERNETLHAAAVYRVPDLDSFDQIALKSSDLPSQLRRNNKQVAQTIKDVQNYQRSFDPIERGLSEIINRLDKAIFFHTLEKQLKEMETNFSGKIKDGKKMLESPIVMNTATQLIARVFPPKSIVWITEDDWTQKPPYSDIIKTKPYFSGNRVGARRYLCSRTVTRLNPNFPPIQTFPAEIQVVEGDRYTTIVTPYEVTEIRTGPKG